MILIKVVLTNSHGLDPGTYRRCVEQAARGTGLTFGCFTPRDRRDGRQDMEMRAVSPQDMPSHTVEVDGERTVEWHDWAWDALTVIVDDIADAMHETEAEFDIIDCDEIMAELDTEDERWPRRRGGASSCTGRTTATRRCASTSAGAATNRAGARRWSAGG